MSSQESNQELSDRVKNVLLSFEDVVQERDELRVYKERLESELAMSRMRSTTLQNNLISVCAERDHYMRYSTEVTVRLTNIQILINESITESRNATFRPNNPVPKREPDPPSYAPDSIEGMEEALRNMHLASAMAGEGSIPAFLRAGPLR